jgi:hypothetical protein
VDPDLWGHLRFGLDFLATGALPAVDPYSFTQDKPWINHEWLSEAIFGLAYRVGAVPGLIALKSALLVATAVLLARIAGRADARVRWWLLALSFIGLTPAAVSFRPQLWTVAGLAALATVLVERRSPWWVAGILPLWANLHGGWMVGAALAGLWTVGRLLDTRSVRAVLPLAAATGVGTLATLINPYGGRLWTFLLATVRMDRNVTEWRPLWQQDDWSHAVMWTVMAAVVAVSTVRGWKRISWAALLPAVWLGASGIFVDRLATLFCEVALLATSEAWSVDRAAPAGARRPVSHTVVDLLVVAAVWALNAVPAARCLPIAGGWAPDLKAAGALSAGAPRGRLVVPFDWGQYALWHWGPGLKVSMDGRRETVYTDETVETQAAIVLGQPDGLDFLTRERPDYVWLPASARRTADWLRAQGYRIDVSTAASFVATRTDLAPLAPAEPAPGCFP